MSDISVWRAYATASGKAMEYIGVAAMNEYVRRHKLNDAQRAVFEAWQGKGIGSKKGGGRTGCWMYYWSHIRSKNSIW